MGIKIEHLVVQAVEIGFGLETRLEGTLMQH
jgi:hypothetical protein